MRMIVLMTDKNTLASSSHAIFVIVLFQSLQPSENGRIFFWLLGFGSKRILAQGIQSYRWRQVCCERGWIDRTMNELSARHLAISRSAMLGCGTEISLASIPTDVLIAAAHWPD